MTRKADATSAQTVGMYLHSESRRVMKQNPTIVPRPQHWEAA